MNAPSSTLIIRLSSLGDVILATAALGEGGVCDWVVASEFAPLLRGHPAVGRLWEFDRSSGLKGWKDLCRRMHAEGYTRVIDLHGSLRSRLLRVWFRAWGGSRETRFRRVRKYRLRLWGMYVFKRLWPRRWLPPRKIDEFARVAETPPAVRPDLSYLTQTPEANEVFQKAGGDLPERYYCVMPASAWPGKQWPVERFVELASRLEPYHAELGTPVVLGTANDPASRRMADALLATGEPFVNGVGRWSLREVAAVIGRATALIGTDTGLAHLAEAVGTRAWVVFGPTVPEMGFGPWRPESRAGGSGLWCRPCGKDGRSCFRIGSDRYACLRKLPTRRVVEEFLRPGGADG